MKYFLNKRFPQLVDVYNSSNTVVLYPSTTSISLNEYRTMIDSSAMTQNDQEFNQNSFHVIVIDGTWAQASGIYHTNAILQNNTKNLFLKYKIRIDTDFVSAYTIRTQPREYFLSTLETVSIILSTIEKNPQVRFYF
jgi:DTW domain-containing protein YfiP